MALNEAFGWVWILVGFVTGLLLGMGFHRDDWMGGYGSLRRRMVRLGHISFLGLGIVNILFALTGPRLVLGSGALAFASWSLIAGGVTMPVCCGLMAWRRLFYWGFGVPVACLLAGGALVVWGVLRR
jgi:hypothetical protein